MQRILPQGLDLVWTRVEPILARAVRRGRGHFTTRDLYTAVLKADQQLWTVTENERLIAALMSEVQFSPAGRGTLTVFCAAGKDVPRWIGQIVEEIGGYARRRGCSELRAVGRKGWQRYLAPYGFRPEAIVLVKDEVFA